MRYCCPKIGVGLTDIENIIFVSKAGWVDLGLSLFHYHSFGFFHVNSQPPFITIFLEPIKAVLQVRKTGFFWLAKKLFLTLYVKQPSLRWCSIKLQKLLSFRFRVTNSSLKNQKFHVELLNRWVHFYFLTFELQM